MSLLIFLTLIVSSCTAFYLSHFIFRPLKSLNNKLLNIRMEGMKIDLENNYDSCKEISELYDVFRSLI